MALRKGQLYAPLLRSHSRRTSFMALSAAVLLRTVVGRSAPEALRRLPDLAYLRHTGRFAGGPRGARIERIVERIGERRFSMHVHPVLRAYRLQAPGSYDGPSAGRGRTQAPPLAPVQRLQAAALDSAAPAWSAQDSAKARAAASPGMKDQETQARTIYTTERFSILRPLQYRSAGERGSSGETGAAQLEPGAPAPQTRQTTDSAPYAENAQSPDSSEQARGVGADSGGEARVLDLIQHRPTKADGWRFADRRPPGARAFRMQTTAGRAAGRPASVRVRAGTSRPAAFGIGSEAFVGPARERSDGRQSAGALRYRPVARSANPDASATARDGSPGSDAAAIRERSAPSGQAREELVEATARAAEARIASSLGERVQRAVQELPPSQMERITERVLQDMSKRLRIEREWRGIS